MVRIHGAVWFDKRESARLLRAIFPRYPELWPCRAVPEWYWVGVRRSES